MKAIPAPLFADSKGNFYDAAGWQALGCAGQADRLLAEADLIPLPPGSDLMYLPGRLAKGQSEGQMKVLGKRRRPVAAILPAGYTRLLTPAYENEAEAPVLPLYGYTAVAWYRGKVWAAAFRTDDNAKWDPRKYNGKELSRLIAQVKTELQGNRIAEHLADCSLKWHCCTAQNFFYRRWEAGIPTSSLCNADCLGCISLQPSECCPSPQSRIAFKPTVEEIATVGAVHLEQAPEAIISFGQGCEGEPALAADVIAPAIREMRRLTSKGLVNMNTNAGYSKGVREIVDAGTDSLRVSMISAVETTHQAYYRSAYTLENVRESIDYAKQKGCHVSVNMLLFPGLNDQPAEAQAWSDFLMDTRVDMVQLRNLNIDPDYLWKALPSFSVEPMGIRQFAAFLQVENPKLQIGNFSHFRPRG